LKIDTELKRVALSMKLEADPNARPPSSSHHGNMQKGKDGYRAGGGYQKERDGRPRPPQSPPPTVQSLKDKFGKSDSAKPPLKTVKPTINIRRLLP
jgi:hypothetical protein